METCERVAHHDPATPQWRDKFFVECTTALMNPTACMSVGTQPWLPALLNCVVIRLNADVEPLLPAREAIAALQILASVARCPAARPAVRNAVMALGQRVDDLFNDRLQGIRSLATVGDTSSIAPQQPAATAKSVVHNTLVVCLMRVEGYRMPADTLLELVDGDVGALMTILLAITKVASYELAITSNSLRVIAAMTQPRLYFSNDGAGGGAADNERQFAQFTGKIRTLQRVWAANQAVDVLLPAVQRRAARWVRELPTTALSKQAAAGSPVTSPVTSSAPSSIGDNASDDATEFAVCMLSLCRAMSNLVHFGPDASEATAIRQHVLVVQGACAAFASLLMCLGGSIRAAVALERRLGSSKAAAAVDGPLVKGTMSALTAALELFSLATRDVRRVVRPLRTALLVALGSALGCSSSPDDDTVGKSDGGAAATPSRFLVAATVALINAGLLVHDGSVIDLSGDVADELVDEEFRAVAVRASKSLHTRMFAATGELLTWQTTVSGHANVHHSRVAAGLDALNGFETDDIDAEMSRLDTESARLEEDLNEMKTARGAPSSAALADDVGTTAPQKPARAATEGSASSTSAPGPAPPAAVQQGSLLGALPSLRGMPSGGQRAPAAAAAAGGTGGGSGTPTSGVERASRALLFDAAGEDDDDLGFGASSRAASSSTGQPATRAASVAPAEFCCTLRGTLMLEPVRLPDGKFVDRRTLADVVSEIGHVDPTSAKPLPPAFDISAVDVDLKNRIAQFRFSVAMGGGLR